MQDTFNSLPENLPKIKSSLSLTQAIAETLSLFPESIVVDEGKVFPVDPPDRDGSIDYSGGSDRVEGEDRSSILVKSVNVVVAPKSKSGHLRKTYRSRLESTVIARGHLCHSTWCPKCSVKNFKVPFEKRLRDMDWHRVRHWMLTVKRVGFKDGQDAYEKVIKRRGIGYLMKKLGRMAKIVITDWVCVLEWHSDGFPHIHLFLEVEKAGRAGRIEKETIERYFKFHGYVHESYYKTVDDWRAVVGYFHRHGYFGEGKGHQSRLPDWAMGYTNKIRRWDAKRREGKIERGGKFSLVSEGTDRLEYLMKCDPDSVSDYSEGKTELFKSWKKWGEGIVGLSWPECKGEFERREKRENKGAIKALSWAGDEEMGEGSDNSSYMEMGINDSLNESLSDCECEQKVLLPSENYVLFKRKKRSYEVILRECGTESDLKIGQVWRVDYDSGWAMTDNFDDIERAGRLFGDLGMCLREYKRLKIPFLKLKNLADWAPVKGVGMVCILEEEELFKFLETLIELIGEGKGGHSYDNHI